MNLLREEAKKFLEQNLVPICDRINEEGEFPEKVFKSFFAAGFGTAFLPEEFGGAGDLPGYADIGMEMGRTDPGFALSVMASAVLFGNNIFLHGTPEQKKKYLTPIVNGEKIGCWALTEPKGGSDALNMQTVCEKIGNEFVISGSKTFITNAPVADYFIVLARLKNTDPKGIEGGCAFILEKNTPGLSLGQPFKKMGHTTSPTGEVFLDEVKVPVTQLLGKEGKAFYDLKRSLDIERILFGSIGVGVIDEALNQMIKYGATRKVFAGSILEHQLIQEKIAQIGAEFEMVKNYLNHALEKLSQGQRVTKEAAVLKLLGAELAVRATDEAIQTLGGYGYMTEYRVERFYRDARLYKIGGGTSEVQKMIVAKEIIKERMANLLGGGN